MSDKSELDPIWKGSMLDPEVVERRKNEKTSIATNDIKATAIFAVLLLTVVGIFWLAWLVFG
jgi:hypothetical protein